MLIARDVFHFFSSNTVVQCLERNVIQISIGIFDNRSVQMNIIPLVFFSTFFQLFSKLSQSRFHLLKTSRGMCCIRCAVFQQFESLVPLLMNFSDECKFVWFISLFIESLSKEIWLIFDIISLFSQLLLMIFQMIKTKDFCTIFTLIV